MALEEEGAAGETAGLLPVRQPGSASATAAAAAARRKPDLLLWCCRALNIVTAICELLCGVALGIAIALEGESADRVRARGQWVFFFHFLLLCGHAVNEAWACLDVAVLAAAPARLGLLLCTAMLRADHLPFAAGPAGPAVSLHGAGDAGVWHRHCGAAHDGRDRVAGAVQCAVQICVLLRMRVVNHIGLPVRWAACAGQKCDTAACPTGQGNWNPQSNGAALLASPPFLQWLLYLVPLLDSWLGRGIFQVGDRCEGVLFRSRPAGDGNVMSCPAASALSMQPHACGMPGTCRHIHLAAHPYCAGAVHVPQVFEAVLTYREAISVGGSDLHKSLQLYRSVACASLLGCAGVYILGGVLCIGAIRKGASFCSISLQTVF